MIKITLVLLTNQMHYTAQLSRVTSYFGDLFVACSYFCVKKKISANLWDAANKVIIKCAAFQICLIYHHFFHLHLNLVRLYFFVWSSRRCCCSRRLEFFLCYFFSPLFVSFWQNNFFSIQRKNLTNAFDVPFSLGYQNQPLSADWFLDKELGRAGTGLCSSS